MNWDVLTSEVLPAVQLSGCPSPPATALEMFDASHIAPSYRRMAHVLWTDSWGVECEDTLVLPPTP